MSPPATAPRSTAVIGAGPAGLMVAEVLAGRGVAVTVYERMRSPGRKLLLAGRGGLNLTHSEPLEDLLERYGPERVALEPAIRAFDPDALRAWCDGLGEPTFVGSSGRVFPRSLRATPLLRAWLRRLDDLGVVFRFGCTWQGWAEDGSGDLCFTDAGGARVTARADATVLALGGASWPRTGSDGAWVGPVSATGVEVVALQAANAGVDVAWSARFREAFAGTPLKNIGLMHRDRFVRGEAMVTAAGLEGGAVYALSRDLREALAAAPDDRPDTTLFVDLRPDVDVAVLSDRLRGGRSKDSRTTALKRTAGLAPVAIGLLREATGNVIPDDPDDLARLIKAAPLRVSGLQPLERAISTAGGIALGEVDGSGMIRRRPGLFVAGEMLDWDAPTGGYLLQATFSTAVAAAHGVIAWLDLLAPDEPDEPDEREPL